MKPALKDLYRSLIDGFVEDHRRLFKHLNRQWDLSPIDDLGVLARRHHVLLKRERNKAKANHWSYDPNKLMYHKDCVILAHWFRLYGEIDGTQ